MNVKKFGHWVVDYLSAIHKHSQAFIFLKPPKHFLGHIRAGKAPIILIPGVFSKWHFLKSIANPLSLRGHPIYALEDLGYHTRTVPNSSKLVRRLIDKHKLNGVIIIAHSKGGLVGKYVLTRYNRDKKIKKLIAIATPFGGSELAKHFSHRAIRELRPESKIIRNLQREKTVNKKIISIYGVFDNHVWPQSSCKLRGAKNIQVPVHGHHKILSSKKVVHLLQKLAV